MSDQQAVGSDYRCALTGQGVRAIEKLNFDVEVSSQEHTEVMHVCDTLSKGDTLIYQIWYD